MLFLSLSSVISILSFSQRGGDGTFSVWLILSIVVSFFLKFIIILPALWAEKYLKSGKKSKFYGTVFGIYIIAFTAFVCFDIVRFCNFATVCPVPEFPSAILSAMVILSALYCALKGVKGTFRGGALIFIAVAVGIIIMCSVMLPRLNTENFNISSYEFSLNGTVRDIVYISLSGAELPLLFLLSHNYKDRLFKPFVLWNTVSSVISLTLMTVAVGTLGAYGKTQIYPMYTAFNAGSVGTLKRFDAIFMSVWILALIVKIAVILIIVKEYGGKLLCFTSALVIFAFGCSRGNFNLLSDKFNNFNLILMILLTVIIPLIIIIKEKLSWKTSLKRH